MNAPAMTQAKPTTSHVKPNALISGTFVTRDLARTRRMCEGILGLECVEPEKGMLLIRERGHRPGEKLAGQPYWVLEAREVGDIAVPQEMLNHWGVFVSSQVAVDEDSNWWEIEYRTPDLVYTALRAKGDQVDPQAP